MAAPLPDRELRKQIVRLRALSATDFDAVIDGLDQDQRHRVLTLLDELEGKSEAADTNVLPASFEPVLLPSDISPWLAARVNGREDSGEESADPFVMTPHTLKALRRCAAAMVPQPTPKTPTPSLLDRLWQSFT